MQKGYVSKPIRTRHGIAFVIRYRVRAADGKWKHKSEALHNITGRKAARATLDQRIRESSTSTVEATEMTFGTFVETYWRPYLDRKCVKPSTRKSYDSALRLHILPKLEAVQILDIAPLHVEELLRAKLETGMSGKTARNLLGLLQSIFALAVDNDLIPRSPVRDKHKPAVRRREKPIWTAEQVRKIVDAANQEHRALFYCAALTGARLGELLGLQWKHIDIEGRKLGIRQTLWEGQLLPPKTPDSIRVIHLGEALAQALVSHRQQSLHVGPEDFVFCRPDGSPLNPDVLRRDVLYPTLDRLGIPRASRSAGFHTFRHSAASMVNAETGNLKLAQKLLGHSNLNTTADVYTHTSAEDERKAALALERAIYGNLFRTVPETANKNSRAAIN